MRSLRCMSRRPRQSVLRLALRLVLTSAVLSLVGSCATVSDVSNREDPRQWYPDLLEGHLEEADRLARLTTGDCLPRLDAAQRQLDRATASQAFAIVLPRGLARQAAIEYQIHLARASCKSGPSTHDEELRLALAAAQRAVAAFRDSLDYQSMAIMQYNVAAALRTLGDASASVSSLQSAIAMDLEYGFEEDAQENRDLLASWNPGASTPPAPASAPQDSVELHFAWSNSDADVELETSLIRAGVNGPLHVSGSRTALRQVRRSSNGGWRISYGPGAIVPGDITEMQPQTLLRALVLPLAQELLELPTIEVSPAGELTQRIVDGQGFVSTLQESALKLLREHSPSGEPSASDTRGIQILFAPDTVGAQAEEDYSIMTAAWIGATLDQGQWYRTEVNLMMPGINQIILAHDVEFSYTRRVPCLEGMAERSCVEIVVHASPQPESVEATVAFVTRTAHLSRILDYWSATYMRLVVDPDTLTPDLRDTRRYWNMCYDEPPCDGESAQERTVWRAAVPRPVPEPPKAGS